MLPPYRELANHFLAVEFYSHLFLIKQWHPNMEQLRVK